MLGIDRASVFGIASGWVLGIKRGWVLGINGKLHCETLLVMEVGLAEGKWKLLRRNGLWA